MYLRFLLAFSVLNVVDLQHDDKNEPTEQQRTTSNRGETGEEPLSAQCCRATTQTKPWRVVLKSNEVYTV